MPEQSDLDRRLRAVERALTDGEHDVAALRDAAELVERLDDLEARVDALEERTADLDAATQAVRGYVGNVRAVNQSVEDRAEAALAAVDRIEARLDGVQEGHRDRDQDDAYRQPTDSDARLRTDGHAQPEASRRTDAAVGASSSSADSQFDIEMPAPGADVARETTDDGDGGERGVVDRVREVL